MPDSSRRGRGGRLSSSGRTGQLLGLGEMYAHCDWRKARELFHGSDWNAGRLSPSDRSIPARVGTACSPEAGRITNERRTHTPFHKLALFPRSSPQAYGRRGGEPVSTVATP